ncbi:MAG: hypothetical protein KAH57_03530 [Thermoplasmata archaeon]|nr:hypothetical protein [Thermoplasmata archaeon]
MRDESGEGRNGFRRIKEVLIGPSMTPMVIVYLSLFAAIGMAVKQIAYPLAAVAAAPLLLPVSPLVAGAYMMWLVAGRAITGYRWSGTFMGAVQAFAAFLLIFGRHGAFNFPLYIASGLAVDIVFLMMGPLSRTMIGYVAATAVSSVVGTLMVVGVELELGNELVIASGLIALGGGTIGGFAAYQIISLHDRTLGERYSISVDPRASAEGR